MLSKNSLVGFVLTLSLGATQPSDPFKDPFRVRGLLEVDPDTGAASLFFPLGPGIGNPELRYVPALLGRFAPQVGIAPSAFELSPGSLDWPLVPSPPDEAPVRWTYTDGSGGCADGLYSGDLNPEEALTRFGYGPMARLAQLPHLGSALQQSPLVLAGYPFQLACQLPC